MGSYLQKYREQLLKESPQKIENTQSDDLNGAISSCLEYIYGKIERGVSISGYRFVAKKDNLVFDMATKPSKIDTKKINAALMNHNNVEVIYFIADNLSTQHSQVSYRYIGDYVNILKSKNQSDLARWVNEFRNKFEENYARQDRKK